MSEGVFSSFNFACGGGSERDSAENVYENHKIAASLFGLGPERICRSFQTHSLTVRKASEADAGRGVTAEPFAEGVDGLYTETPELLLTVRYADCVPVLLCDLASGAVAAVHSGWKGTLGGIAARAAEKLAEISGGAGSIIAAIGPCARPCCYEVSDELYGIFTAADPENAAAFAPCRRGHYMLDMAKIIKRDLNRAGVPGRTDIRQRDMHDMRRGRLLFAPRIGREPRHHGGIYTKERERELNDDGCFGISLCGPAPRFSVFAVFAGEAERRRTELRGAFTSAVLFAKSRHADIFIISGDLFDGELVTRDTCELLRSQFESFPECRFFISPGNHDPYNDASVYRHMDFPSNVHVFGPEKERVRLDGLGVDVYGFGFTQKTCISSPVAGYPALDGERINILVCHGDTSSPLSPNGPVTKAEIAASGFDYIALGHIHAPSGVLKEGRHILCLPRLSGGTVV